MRVLLIIVSLLAAAAGTAYAQSIIMISDVQIDRFDSYPESCATIASSQIGSRTVYDCGDLSEHGWGMEYDVYQSLFPSSMPVPGNHDWYTSLADWRWSQTVDVVDQGVHLVGFDAALRTNASAMEWLATTLDDGPDVFTVFFTHYPLYSCNVRNGGVASVMLPYFLPMLNAAEVELVVCGHGHAYERHQADGRTYLVIGGGGAHLDQLGSSPTLVLGVSEHHYLEIFNNGNSVSCIVHGLNGNVLDTFTVTSAVAVEPMTWGRIKTLFL